MTSSTDPRPRLTTYNVYVAMAKKPGFDWTDARAGIRELDLAILLGAGLERLLEIPHAIDAGELRGRQLDWGAWIVQVSRADILEFESRRGRTPPPALESLSPEGAYYLVAFES